MKLQSQQNREKIDDNKIDVELNKIHKSVVFACKYEFGIQNKGKGEI